jgi:hypothetical protein
LIGNSNVHGKDAALESQQQVSAQPFVKLCPALARR